MQHAKSVESMSIDPNKEYPLGYLVKHRLFGPVKQFSTARAKVLFDLLSDEPILNATLTGEGRRRSIIIKGANLLRYLEVMRYDY